MLLELEFGTARVTLGREPAGDVTLRFGDASKGQVLDGQWRQQILIDDDQKVIAGRLPQGAVSAEAVLSDGQRVPCAAGSGVWMTGVSPVERDPHTYPVLFRDGEGKPVAPALPADWKQEPADRLSKCPACEDTEWDLVTPRPDVAGSLRPRWGLSVTGPISAFVCRTCGHQEKVNARLGGGV
jgi:hypothetical protein